MGGEKVQILLYEDIQKGSPPRGRGKGCLFRLCPIRIGITPAWAGKSCFGEVCVDGLEDHPRVGGEKMRASPRRTYLLGSPPRGRGKVTGYFGVVIRTRITPAWAGKSMEQGGVIKYTKDHPRVGGEKKDSERQPSGAVGSPPRGRGKVTRLYALADMEGITPAWAGKRRPGVCVGAWRGDHPRVGGEKCPKRL